MSFTIAGGKYHRHQAAPHRRKKIRMIYKRRSAGTGSRPKRFGA